MALLLRKGKCLCGSETLHCPAACHKQDVSMKSMFCITSWWLWHLHLHCTFFHESLLESSKGHIMEKMIVLGYSINNNMKPNKWDDDMNPHQERTMTWTPIKDSNIMWTLNIQRNMVLTATTGRLRMWHVNYNYLETLHSEQRIIVPQQGEWQLS